MDVAARGSRGEAGAAAGSVGGGPGREGEGAGERPVANKRTLRPRVARGGRDASGRKPAQRAPLREKADE